MSDKFIIEDVPGYIQAYPFTLDSLSVWRFQPQGGVVFNGRDRPVLRTLQQERVIRWADPKAFENIFQDPDWTAPSWTKANTAYIPWSNICQQRRDGIVTHIPICEFEDTKSSYTTTNIKLPSGKTVKALDSWTITPNGLRYCSGYPSVAPMRLEPDLQNERLRDEKSLYLNLYNGASDADVGGLVLQLLELKDMPQLLKSVRSFLRFLASPKNWLKKEGVSAKTVASAYLAVQYGVIPTIQQIEFFTKTLWAEVEEFQSSVQKLQKQLQNVDSDTVSPWRAVTARSKLFRKNDAWDKESDYLYGLRKGRLDYIFSEIASPEKRWPQLGREIELHRRWYVDGGWQDAAHSEQVRRHLDTAYTPLYGTYIDEEDALAYSRFFADDILMDATSFSAMAGLFFDIVRPFENGWQIFPLSFVADWFMSYNQTAERIDGLLRSLTCKLRPIDGVWKSYRTKAFVGTNMPDSLTLTSYRYDPIFEVVEGKSIWRGVDVIQVYQPRWGIAKYPVFGHQLAKTVNGDFYDRHQFSYSAFQLLMPHLTLNFNLSKITSLTAIAVNFT